MVFRYLNTDLQTYDRCWDKSFYVIYYRGNSTKGTITLMLARVNIIV
nr:MAG TPA: hypothetical protein [Crassvirales sp.]